MNFLNKIGSLLGTVPRRTLVGKDKRGNEFYTKPHSRDGEPPKRLVDYHGPPEPSELHPLWKHWLVHARDAPPTDKDIFMWELEQVRLQRRLKEIDAASNKMRSEEMAQRERGDSGMANAIAQLTSQLEADVGASKPSEKRTGASQTTLHFAVPPQPQNPTTGSNLAFEDGKQIVPKSHTPYSPDPSRIQSILTNKSSTSSSSSTSSGSSTSSNTTSSTWVPSTATKGTDLDDL